MPHMLYLCDSLSEKLSGSLRTMTRNGEADAHSQGDFVCRPSDALDAVGIRFLALLETEIRKKIKQINGGGGGNRTPVRKPST